MYDAFEFEVVGGGNEKFERDTVYEIPGNTSLHSCMFAMNQGYV